jgi:hypothetical protein
VINRIEEVTPQKGGYAIANTSDLKEFSSQFRSSTLAEINSHFNTLINEDPELEDEIQIVESYELAG